MTTQPTVKAQKAHAFDWLCWVLVTFGLFCLGVSLPATYQMVRVAHDEMGSYLLLLVLELMAFFSLLAPLWVSPQWAKKFSHIATALLTVTTIGNYVAGWNYLWTEAELPSLWKGLRDYELIGGFYPFAVLLVGMLSAAVPFGMKFFIGLAIQRYRENELEHTPEAVAARMVEPFVVQVVATRLMQEQLMGLTTQFREPLVLPNLQPTVKAQAALADLGIDVNAEMERILAERAAERREGEHRPPFVPLAGLSEAEVAETLQAVQKAWTPNDAPSFVPPAAAPQPTGKAQDEDENDWEQHWEEDEEERMTVEEALVELEREGWEGLSWEAIDVLPDSEEKSAELERRRQGREELKQLGLKFLRDAGLLKPAQPTVEAQDEVAAPDAVEASQAITEAQDAPEVLREPAPEPVSASVSGGGIGLECELCGGPAVNSDKAACKRGDWPKKLDGKVACKGCREKLR